MTVLDDFESRPGSATSLLRTLVGATLRDQGGWMPVSALVTLMSELDVPPARTRTALGRVKAKGLLVAEARDGVAGYAVARSAADMLARGDRRIFGTGRTGNNAESWCLISWSVPEDRRDLRHRLRRRLAAIGCGSVSSALWICPDHLADEVALILDELELTGRATVFLASEIRYSGGLAAAIARWWDLPALRELHERFLAGHAEPIARLLDATLRPGGPGPSEAFRTWIHALDAYRPIPYLDPGLPPRFLPDDWPGTRSAAEFTRLAAAARVPAGSHAAAVAADAGRPRHEAPHRPPRLSQA
ncbi:PaaX family transcriptional regulator [Myceligenerans indicum]|uniref:PaaX family transcriptional regulator n=1 Tax=Myceligenerans indicum TaxID=2593663 RepID=UPI0027DBC5ED|nr:PaaX family transcriptional regulator C-terminal domain-containing protein [Myceligenerans indicum]